TISYLLYASILVHAFQGWLLWRKNAAARGTQYAVKVTRTVNTSSVFSRNMGWLGTVIFIFILIHMYQFWFQMHWGGLGTETYAGQSEPITNLYQVVAATYTSPGFVIFYVIAMAIIAFHLWHGFQSAFQTLGLHHKKYWPLVQAVGRIYAVVVPAAFAIIPIVMYLQSM